MHSPRPGLDFFAERYHRAFDEEGPLLLALIAARSDMRITCAPLSLCLNTLLGELAAHARQQDEANDEGSDNVDVNVNAGDVARAVAATREVLVATRAVLPARRTLFARIAHILDEVEAHLDEERAASLALTL